MHFRCAPGVESRISSAGTGHINHIEQTVERRSIAERRRRVDRGRFVFATWAVLFLIGGAVYSFGWLGTDLRFPDERDYLALADHLASLDGFSLDGETATALRPPGYPFVLAPIIGLVDSIHAVRIGQFALLVLACRWLGRLISASTGLSAWRTSTVVLFGVMCYPVLIYTAGTVFPQTVLLALMSALVVCLVREHVSLSTAGLVGVLSAFIVQVSPTALSVPGAALVFVCFSSHWCWRRVLVVVLSFFLLLGAWTVRNVVVLGEPVVFSQNLAHNIDNAVLTFDPLEEGESRAPDSTFGYGIDRLVQYAQSPDLYAKHVFDFFAHRNVLFVAEESTTTRDRIMFVTYYGLLLMVACRLLLLKRHALSPAEWFAIGLYIATALFHAMVIPRIRYRLPFDFLLLLPAANAVLLIWKSRFKRPSSLRASG